MAKRLFTSVANAFTATAANAQASSGAYMALTGSSSTQTTDVLEIMVGGMATSSTLGGFQFARQSTAGTGGASALAAPNSDGPMHFATAALASAVTAAVAYVTNQPITSNSTTDARISLALNGFGGILRWNAAPGQQYTLVGNTGPGGGGILYNSTSGSGATCAANAHIIYETY